MIGEIDPADLEPAPEDAGRYGAGPRGMPYASLRRLVELPCRPGTMDGAYRNYYQCEMIRRSKLARERARARLG